MNKEKIIDMINQSAPAEKFIKQLVSWGVLTKEQAKQDYSLAIKGKCRYFAPWFIATVAGTNKNMQKKFIIHEGTVNGKHHVWVEYEGYYIDGTIAQFIGNSEKIVVIKKDETNELYGPSRTYNLIQWFDREENSAF